MAITIGQLLIAKSGKRYIKLGQPRSTDGSLAEKKAVSDVFPITLADGTVLNEGDNLWCVDPRDELKDLNAKGVIDQDTMVQRLGRIAGFFKYKLQVNAVSEPADEAKGA